MEDLHENQTNILIIRHVWHVFYIIFLTTNTRDL